MSKFKPGDIATVYNTNCEYDGQSVEVVGIASNSFNTCFYIIRFLNMKAYDGWSCIPLIEHCLKPITE